MARERQGGIFMTILSVVSPVHCEGEHVRVFLDEVEAVLVPLLLRYEIILVDDGSTDDSWARMLEETTRRSSLRCLRLSRNFGKEAALAAGLEAASGQAVITLDSDLQHPPALIPEMVRIWQDNEADVVEARKKIRQNESGLDRLFAFLFYRAYSLLTSADLEGASDFKLLDRHVVDAWKSMRECKIFYRGMITWLGFRHRELLFAPEERRNGGSKWSFLKKLRLALDSLTAFSSRPLSLIWILGFFFFLFACVMGVEALWMKLRGSAMTGFTTVILLILVTGTAVLSAICLLSVYIRQNFHEAKARPRYLIRETAGYPGATRHIRGRVLPPDDGTGPFQA
jgi:dolichol-phosphate mannosyltransferase